MSPISSSSNVPPSACSKHPTRCVVAPLNAPRSCPNISVSISVSGTAAQLTATNGPFLRSPLKCNAFATSSLPVPLSPVSSTLTSVSTARCMSSPTLRIPGLAPMMPLKAYVVSSSERRRRTSAFIRSISISRETSR